MLTTMRSTVDVRRLRLLGLAASFILAACGGGEEPTAVAAEPAPAPAPAPTDPPPSSGTVPGTRATCNLAGFAAEMLSRVNARRAAGAACGTAGTFAPTVALAWNDPLTQASLVHSDDMVAGNFFSHTGSDGSSAGQRATAAGYVWRAWGENIAAGQPSVASVVDAWMASPGHCANIMSATFRDIGVACVNGGAGNTYRTYWTMTLGAPR